jgi:SAM-dependent methyltransferase
MDYEIVSNCRVCNGSKLLTSLQFGDFASCGIFPEEFEESVSKGELTLMICEECLLVQLDRNFDLDSLFREDYGYESSLNKSMVRHLNDLADFALKYFEPILPISVLDIGSNDGTLINNILGKRQIDIAVAVDPTLEKFRDKYLPSVEIFPSFFSLELSEKIEEQLGNKFDLITSIAMFYDLPNPNNFVEGIFNLLSEDGIWVLELSHLESMINANAFDTVCHEHLEYYSLRALSTLMTFHSLQINEIEFNSSNGGSIRLVISKNSSRYLESNLLHELLDKELSFAEDVDDSLISMMKRVDINIEKALDYIKVSKKPLFALGASTKGNCFLQYAKSISSLVQGVAEINPVKFGRFTPGTKIPIHPEKTLLKSEAIFLVLPWHFGDGLVETYRNLIESGKLELVYVLPEFRVVHASNIEKIEI